jgi:hypothetical protein
VTEVVPIETRPMTVSRLFPWIRLFRGPAIALDARKLLLAALGLVLLWTGWAGLDRVFAYPLETATWLLPEELADLSGTPVSLGKAAEPFFVLISPFVSVFRTGQGLPAFPHALLASVWAVMVWGILGGAIGRMAAVELATGERVGMFSALRFATTRFVALIGAPLSPLIGIGFFAALCLPVGLLYWIPGSVGTTIAGFLAFIPLVAGLVMALLVAYLATGWPLMIATVTVESEDIFDALSRSYSYVSERLGRYGFYTFVAWVIGAVGFLVVSLLAALVVHMAQWGLSFSGPDAKIASLFAGDRTQGPTPAAIHAFWISLIRLLTHGFLYSYFFTASTIIYVLIRKDVDGTPYHDLGRSTDEAPLAVPMERVDR